MEYVIQLLCNICGVKQGEHIVSSKHGWTGKTATTENCGFIDVRCDACTALYGTFKEMVEEYKTKYSDDGIEAENFVSQNRKKGDFDKELGKLLEEKP